MVGSRVMVERDPHRARNCEPGIYPEESQLRQANHMKSRKSFLLRIDPKLYDQLAAMAAQEFRSVNGQIEFLLREAVARRRGRVKPGEQSESHDDSSEA
jgi:hypothetical protein